MRGRGRASGEGRGRGDGRRGSPFPFSCSPEHCPASRAAAFTLSLLQPSAMFCTAETCTGQDLADLGDRLRDWFQLLRENSKQNGSANSAASPAGSMGDQCSVWGWVGSGRQEGALQMDVNSCAPSHQILSLWCEPPKSFTWKKQGWLPP